MIDCVSLCICLRVSHRCVSLLARVWPLDVWGELVPSKIFNPPFPVLKARYLVSDSYIGDIWVSGWVSFYILSKIPVWLVCYTHGFHVDKKQVHVHVHYVMSWVSTLLEEALYL